VTSGEWQARKIPARREENERYMHRNFFVNDPDAFTV